jgi:hypothetical protein
MSLTSRAPRSPKHLAPYVAMVHCPFQPHMYPATAGSCPEHAPPQTAPSVTIPPMLVTGPAEGMALASSFWTKFVTITTAGYPTPPTATATGTAALAWCSTSQSATPWPSLTPTLRVATLRAARTSASAGNRLDCWNGAASGFHAPRSACTYRRTVRSAPGRRASSAPTPSA